MLRQKLNTESHKKLGVDFSGIQEGTTAHSIITDINNSDDTEIIEEKLKNITWNDEREKQLLAFSKELLETNKTSVEAKIKKIEQEISSIRELKDNVKEMEALISQGAVSEYQVLAKERKEGGDSSGQNK